MEISPIEGYLILRLPGATDSVRKMTLTEKAQHRIEAVLQRHADEFIDPNLARVKFDPTYSTDEESVLWIEGFELPGHIQDAISTPEEVPEYPIDHQHRGAKALFYVGRNESIFFQCWRSFDFLSREKIWLLLDGSTFDLEERPPIVVGDRIDAVFHEGNLFFKSYANTRTMLNMLDYVSDATAEDITAFVEHSLFSGNAELLQVGCSHLQKRHIRELVQSGVLDNQDIGFLIEKAYEVDYDLPTENGKIVLPAGGKELTELLCFLRDRLYRGPVSGETYLANSARRRNPD